MSNKHNEEILLKYTNNVKETNDTNVFEPMKMFSCKFLTEHLHATLNALTKSKRKKYKFEMITAQSSPPVYKRYYIDENKQEHIEECLINITVKQAKDKPLSFEEKLTMLSEWIKINRREPNVGDMYNNFDVGKFYNSSLVNKDKYEQVENIVEQLL